ncbi:hypothetical protein BJ165DRAFT_1484939, partial [Panaeolus papilionaceus]
TIEIGIDDALDCEGEEGEYATYHGASDLSALQLTFLLYRIYALTFGDNTFKVLKTTRTYRVTISHVERPSLSTKSAMTDERSANERELNEQSVELNGGGRWD